jgi:formylglycine-generating enzyme required for sulfatase activity
VEEVSWNAATEYCRKWTELEHQAGRLPADWEYRLPTEAQREYACRAGTTTATAFGDQLSSQQANFKGNSPYSGADQGPFLARPTEVGVYPANGWGFCDMQSNVNEWCRDFYQEKLPGGVDPEVSFGGPTRVVRGGGWWFIGRDCRSARRWSDAPDHAADFHTGFRAAAAPVGRSNP